jgi:hypothetical protein
VIFYYIIQYYLIDILDLTFVLDIINGVTVSPGAAKDAITQGAGSSDLQVQQTKSDFLLC